MVEAAGSSTLLIATYQTTRCHSLKTVIFTVTTVWTSTVIFAGMFIIQQQKKIKFYNPLSFINVSDILTFPHAVILHFRIKYV
jgi:hypothetical protein